MHLLYFFDLLSQWPFFTAYVQFVIGIIGNWLIKHSMTFWNINNPLKVFLQLDSLTCCPEVELSLSEEAFYGLGGGGENRCLFRHLCLAFLIGSIPGSSGRT